MDSWLGRASALPRGIRVGRGGGQTVGCVKGLRWMVATAGGQAPDCLTCDCPSLGSNPNFEARVPQTAAPTNIRESFQSMGTLVPKLGPPSTNFTSFTVFFFALKVRNWTKMGKNGQKKLPAQIFCAKKIFIFAHLHIADFLVFCTFAPFGLARTDDSFPGCQIAWKVWWGVNPKGCGVGAPLSTHNGTW